jgi:hypothetical protein
MREFLGYLSLVLAILTVFFGIWAARYFAPHRVYGRSRARERKRRGKFRSSSEGMDAEQGPITDE